MPAIRRRYSQKKRPGSGKAAYRALPGANLVPGGIPDGRNNTIQTDRVNDC